MNKEHKQLAALAKVASLHVQSCELNLAKCRRRETELQKALTHISGISAQRVSDPTAYNDPARRGGADIQWAKWVDQRRTMINQEIAKCRAEQANALTDFKRAFSKHLAICALIDAKIEG